MPIAEFLDGYRPDPETRRIMGLAFEMARAALRLRDQDDPVVAMVAKRIIELAKAGERDPTLLRDRTLSILAGRLRKAGGLGRGNSQAEQAPATL